MEVKVPLDVYGTETLAPAQKGLPLIVPVEMVLAGVDAVISTVEVDAVQGELLMVQVNI